ncbi:MAG: transcriptional regulator MntR [Exiguobacterium sp.]|uniref:Manganese transport regulator n=1 Tax=Exiguobacterium alkaliphilum TaxID=1428684 RepID=A0ABT2KYP0_9BACL|nr:MULTISPECIES: transcriptional regulator MntR [Exiguobacterium]MDX5324535.1 transcriptional regulator MntR [Exiguobacterium sp.]KDN58784.1 manganese transport transcriptional regulator [Exiguobacterium sp. AB2]MCT4795576.1 transcriptional regulator MntR [Exiguobacterium alkaliphilum]MDX5426379.1 transcriptional regulator MntR [Exiguobacterium sp.]MDX6773752.1 transcriptional regulator MntR [Exiguobacterium sp.]
MPTPSMEDYLERIYLLMEEKGYARVSDIAEHLGVHPSSVTKMVQKLDREDYLVYEKYRGLMLTHKGQKIGKRLVERHTMLESFLRLIGADEAHVYEDVEGIEHHLSSDTLDCMTGFVEFFEDKPELMEQFHEFQQHRRTQDES